MSRRNGNRAKFHIDRKRRLRHRASIRTMMSARRANQATAVPPAGEAPAPADSEAPPAPEGES